MKDEKQGLSDSKAYCPDVGLWQQPLQQDKYDENKKLASLGVLAGGIAHDFNNLLSVILGNTCLANKHITSPEQLAIYLSRIEQASNNAASLCQQMLTYAGQGSSRSHIISLSSIVLDMTKLLQVSLFKHVSVTYQLPENLPKVKVNVSQIQQVIMNLITNANEAMQDNVSGMISVHVGVMTVDDATLSFSGDITCEGEYIYIEVRDQGCGMNEATQSQIFEPFFTTKFAGHGLGMSTVLSIVDGHHGLVQLESELGKGSVFRIAFPALDKVINQDDEMSEEYDALEKFQPSGKILLVDDEETVLEIMEVMLEDLGFSVIVAHDGVEAADIYHKHWKEIQIVLMDMTMPKMNGKDSVLALQKVNPNVKILLSSGYSEDDISMQFKDMSLAGFLQKPCSLKQLYQALKLAL